MTNDTTPQPLHIANALHFIVESLAEGEVESTGDLKFLDYESLMEFAEMGNFTYDAFGVAMRLFERAYLAEEKVMRDR